MTTIGPDADTSASEPELVVTDEAITAVVRAVVPVAELPAFYDSSFRTLAEVVSAQQLALASAAFGLYHGPPTETADLEVGFATDSAVRPDGAVVSSSLPGGRVGPHGSLRGVRRARRLVGTTGVVDRRAGPHPGAGDVGGLRHRAIPGHGPA